MLSKKMSARTRQEHEEWPVLVLGEGRIWCPKRTSHAYINHLTKSHIHIYDKTKTNAENLSNVNKHLL